MTNTEDSNLNGYNEEEKKIVEALKLLENTFNLYFDRLELSCDRLETRVNSGLDRLDLRFKKLQFGIRNLGLDNTRGYNHLESHQWYIKDTHDPSSFHKNGYRKPTPLEQF